MKRIFSTLALALSALMCTFAQKVFTIEGTVDQNITDSCYNVYIGDEYFHIDESKVDMCVPVVDKKFRIEIPCEKMTSGRIRCIFPDGEVCSASIAFFVVPGETIKLNVHNGYYDSDQPYSYKANIERGVLQARKANPTLVTPYTPKYKGKMWKTVKYDMGNDPTFYVKDITFAKDATILHIMSDRYTDNLNLGKKAFIEDDHGNRYKILRADVGTIDGNNDQEVRVYGGYFAFEPVKHGAGAISLFNGEPNVTLLANIMKAKEKKQKPNFRINVTVSQGIGDCGYLVSLLNKYQYQSSIIDEITVNKDRKAAFSMHLDERQVGDLTAIFPDGSICTHCVRFPFVPGETAEVKVKNGTFHLSGTGFYKEWEAASELVDNAEKYHKESETKELITEYFKEHATEKGCLAYYTQYEILPYTEMEKMLPESVSDSEDGIEIQARAAAEKASKARTQALLKLQEETKEGKTYKDFVAVYDSKMQRLSDYVGKGKYILVHFWTCFVPEKENYVSEVNEVWKTYGGEKLEVIGIPSWGELSIEQKYIKDFGIEYPQIFNAPNIARDLYGCLASETMLLAPDGTILKRGLKGHEILEAVKKYIE